MARRPSLLLDTTPRRPSSAASSSGTVVTSDVPPVSWIYGRVTQTSATDPSLPAGWVEVGIPADNPATRAVGQSDGLSVWIGARVQVILDSAGRVVHISDPIADPRPEDEVQHIGQQGRALRSAMDDAAQAQKRAEEARTRADNAREKAYEAGLEAKRALAVGEANRPPVVAPEAPTDPVPGLIWYPTNVAGEITGARVWDGAQWIGRPLVADTVLVPGSVGTVALHDGAVTADKVHVTEELTSRIAAFLAVTTDMLTAGKATIQGDAVVGNLIGNKLIGGELSLLDSTPEPRNVYADLKGSSWGWEVSPGRKHTGELRAGVGGTWDASSLPSGPAVLAYHKGIFGPAEPGMSEITITMTLTAKWLEGTATVVLVLADGTQLESAPIPANGQIQTIRMVIPEGQWLSPTERNILVRATRFGNVGGDVSVTVRDMKALWRPLKASGVRVFRDEDGDASIEFRESGGGVATLTTDGVIYRPPGGEPASQGWGVFTQPPLVISSTETAGAWASPRTWTRVPLNGSVTLRGGMKVLGDEIIVPLTGFYRMDGKTWYRGAKDYTGGTAVAINGSTNKGVYTYQPMNRGTWTSLVASGVKRLNAGDRISLYTYHDAASGWRMDYGDLSAQYLTA